MCEICRCTPCVPTCPNAEPDLFCARCDEKIRKGNKYFSAIDYSYRWAAFCSEDCLYSMNTTKYNAGTYTVYRRETQQVVIDDSQKIPAEFLKTRVSEMPNKTLIKECIKEGKEVAGAHLR